MTWPPTPALTNKLVIPTGKNKGEHLSIASVYRVLAETEDAPET
ncbi:hypothetical protein [Streptomyces sp. 6N223]